LRQVFYSLILATWYKKKIKDSILNKVYSNQNKITGVNVSAQDKDRIYQQYLKAFKKGVFNYIKEDTVSNPELPSQEQGIYPRKYFSGGVEAKYQIGEDLAMVGPKQIDSAQMISIDKAQVIDVLANVNPDYAMSTDEIRVQKALSRIHDILYGRNIMGKLSFVVRPSWGLIALRQPYKISVQNIVRVNKAINTGYLFFSRIQSNFS